MKRKVIPFIFLSPALLFGIVFFVLPIVVAFYLTFTNFQAFAPVRGVGLANYKYLLTRDPFFFEEPLPGAVAFHLLAAHGHQRNRGRVCVEVRPG